MTTIPFRTPATTPADSVSRLQRMATDPSSSLNWVLNRFRTVRTWREFSDPYGYGEGHERIWYVATCRRCKLAERATAAAGLAWFQTVHHHH